MRHLAESATIADYEQLIYDIVNDGRSVVYLYVFRGRHYYAVRGFSKENDEWLVIFGQNGIIETAFPPESPDNYLEHRGFVHLARTVEVLGWTKEVNN